MRIVKYVIDADGALEIPAIPAPRAKFKSAEEAVALSYESEVRVTGQINTLVDLAVREKDHLTKNMLEWFIAEQREEVSSMDTLLRMVRRAGEKGLLFVEQYIGRSGVGEHDEGEGGDS